MIVIFIFIIVGIFLSTIIARIDHTLNDNNLSLNSCYNGSYRVKDLPFDSCSGYRKCEKGFYCQNGIKYPCPSGYYGNNIGLNTPNCSGICSAGFYCSKGSISATSNFCGYPDKYCPTGSSNPLISPSGYYTVDINGNDYIDSMSSRSSIKICPLGYYCMNGIKSPCPAGFFGDSYGLSESTCTGICPEGWYCPSASVNPFEFTCGNSPLSFCPEGSGRKLFTKDGYYAIHPHLDIGGGYGAEKICPRGSYCLNGIRNLCRGGRYGSQLRETNTSCAGICTAGFFCPEGSITNKEKQCPSSAEYCPAGSAIPIPVALGYYTIGHAMLDFTIAVDYTYAGGTAGDMQVSSTPFHDLARTTQALCEPGYYCLSDGLKRMCPTGRYGSTYGLSTPSCSGYCSAGYYCPEGSQHFNQTECGSPDKFCPSGSAIPRIVNIGYYTVLGEGLTTRSAERRCEPGFYCQHGIKSLCLSGYWGETYGLSIPTCSGQCKAGYYCPEGSILAIEKVCGDANKYCPEGSSFPLIVSSGYYSVGGNDSTRYDQIIAPAGHYAFNGLLYVCPAGFYGSVSGLSSSYCSGPCYIKGYFCPTGSISPVMKYCGGDNVFCPSYTVAPINVHHGFYTADYLYEKCPPGKWRSLIFHNITDANIVRPIVTVSPLADCQLCPEGTYKHIAGDDLDLCLPCGEPQVISSEDRITCECNIVPINQEEGYVYFFNVTTSQCIKLLHDSLYLIDASAWNPGNALTRFEQFPCTPGHYCRNGLQYKCPHGRYGTLTQESRPLCEGVCTKGYFCLESSTSPMSYPCGDAKYICPEGSFIPTLVPEGYYSNENVPESLRYFQNICPLGYYCPGDGKRYPCTPGTFTDQVGTILSTCMGPCDRGHYCGSASPTRTQFKCGNATVYCPRGSFEPTLVTDGFYGIYTGDDGGEQQLWDVYNSTLSAELPCEPGYYCKAGIKSPCPPGTFGYRYGMVEASCTGLCAAGYYCPSVLEPQPDAALYTIWPRVPQTTATAFECGDVRYYCPKGTKYPLIVGRGNYSIGGSSHNRTRVDQIICNRGSYCLNAISILCPPGRYGNTYGLADKSCTATCPAGYYCPSGTINPYPCSPTEYSTGSVSYCSQCPGNRITPLLCQYEKGCCFRG